MKTNKIKKNRKGITLLALVITIIVLLILAAVTVNLTLGDGGILGGAKEVVNEWDKATEGEQSDLSKLAEEMRDARNGIYNNTSGGTGGNEPGSGGNQETEPTHKPSTDTVDETVSFITETGKIDIVWLDTNNRIIDKPNSPAEHLGGMTPVKWDGVTEQLTTASDPEWYNYIGIEGDEDNTTSHWANAINYGSYFVWIPRYAYRITYYDPSFMQQPTGYYDGCGMWKATGELKLGLEEGIETVVKDGWSYIVHPAFIDDSANGFNNGGWDSDLAGIWVGKYECSRSDATSSSVGSSNVIKVVPEKRSWKNMQASNCFTQSYNYERTKESHMAKNSEWGAVAYLTHSKYGRNGHKIDDNQNSDCITGNGKMKGSSTKITYAYNTEIGQLASSTGNIYGVYDLSGGGNELVSACINGTLTDYGFAITEANIETINNNNKYVTTYVVDDQTEVKEYDIGKMGDATKEVFANNGNSNWFYTLAAGYAKSNYYWTRGGQSTLTSGAYKNGIFYNYYNSSNTSSHTTWRLVLSIS